MNTLDFIVIGVLVAFAAFGYRRGLVYTAFRLASYFIALLLAINLYPHVSRFLRESFVYEVIRDGIRRSNNFGEAFRRYSPAPGIDDAIRGNDLINALPIPQQLRDVLHDNNTPDMFDLLRVGTIEDYITGFFANIVINVLSMLIVFLLVLLILRIAGSLLRVVEWLPVIGSLNRIGGLAAGALIGVIVAWLGLSIATMFLSAGGNEVLYGLMQGSSIMRWLFVNEWLLTGV